MSERNSGTNNPFFGKKHTKEFIERMSQERSGKSWEERLGEDKAKSLKEQHRLIFSGEGNPFFGREHSLETRAKISANHRSCSGSLNPMFGQEDKIRGEKNGAWIDGQSVIYDNFTDELKTEIRKRDKFTCQICGVNGFIVHHIDYDKKNANHDNLITLCSSCHGKTNFNRDAWVRFFNDKKS